MAWINYAKATLAGRLVDYPCIGVTTTGVAACRFALAVNCGKERTLLFCKAYGETAERIATKYAKGSNILIDCLIHNKDLPQPDGREVLSVEFEAVAEYTVDTLEEYRDLLEDENDESEEI